VGTKHYGGGGIPRRLQNTKEAAKHKGGGEMPQWGCNTTIVVKYRDGVPIR
jgi:hypothetical protein